MQKRSIALVLVTASLVLCAVLFAQTNQQPKVATDQPAVVPDLSGIWNTFFPPDASNPYGRPYIYFSKEVPLQPWAEARYKANRKGQGEARPDQGRADRDPSRYPYCMPAGFPRVYGYEGIEIVQNPGRVYVLFDGGSVQRIYTDGRKLPQGPPLTFMGQSIGRWEGDTLIVETKDMNALTWIDTMGHPHSDALRVEERIRRVDHNNLQIDFLFDDPKAYTKPWTGKRMYKIKPTKDTKGDYTSETFACEDHVTEDYSQKVLGEKPRDDAWRELRNEGSGY